MHSHYLLIKELGKITSVVNFIPSKCLKFASRCLESSLAHWVKCTYRELRSVLRLLQTISWCAKGGHKLHLFQQHDLPLNPIPSRVLFGLPPTSIKRNFFLEIAMKLKFPIASQLSIRKILPKYFLKNMHHYGIMTSF